MFHLGTQRHETWLLLSFKVYFECEFRQQECRVSSTFNSYDSESEKEFLANSFSELFFWQTLFQKLTKLDDFIFIKRYDSLILKFQGTYRDVSSLCLSIVYVQNYNCIKKNHSALTIQSCIPLCESGKGYFREP